MNVKQDSVIVSDVMQETFTDQRDADSLRSGQNLNLSTEAEWVLLDKDLQLSLPVMLRLLESEDSVIDVFYTDSKSTQRVKSSTEFNMNCIRDMSTYNLQKRLKKKKVL